MWVKWQRGRKAEKGLSDPNRDWRLCLEKAVVAAGTWLVWPSVLCPVLCPVPLCPLRPLSAVIPSLPGPASIRAGSPSCSSLTNQGGSHGGFFSVTDRQFGLCQIRFGASTVSGCLTTTLDHNRTCSYYRQTLVLYPPPSLLLPFSLSISSRSGRNVIGR